MRQSYENRPGRVNRSLSAPLPTPMNARQNSALRSTRLSSTTSNAAVASASSGAVSDRGKMNMDAPGDVVGDGNQRAESDAAPIREERPDVALTWRGVRGHLSQRR